MTEVTIVTETREATDSSEIPGAAQADLRLPRRLRLAGLLLGLGLLIEAATLFWPHPTAFLAFLLVGGVLVAAGIVVYLLTIATAGPPRS